MAALSASPGPPRSALRLLYLSNGNVPSRWAHTIQIMKMSEALAGLVPGFELVIGESLRDRVSPRVDLWQWYGIERPFPVRRLPLWAWRRAPIFESVHEPRFTFAAPRYAARLRPALVWTRSFAIAEACVRRELPVLLERHAVTTEKWHAQRARVATSPNLRGVVTLSGSLCEALAKEGFPAEKIAAFASSATPKPLVERQAARRALGLAASDAIAIYAGRLSEDKGLPTLLAAAARLPRVRFLVLGGNEGEAAHWRARAGANVQFPGFVPNALLPTWLAAADVGLFTNSARDPLAAATSPLKLYEYIAAGLPVVASRIAAVSSWLRDGDNAYLFAPDDAVALAAAIERALGEPTAAAACAERARAGLPHGSWRERAQAILQRFAPELLARRS